jgi:hypothetical protein
MTIKYKISIFTLLLAGVCSTQSCKKFLDVNTSPNTLPYDKATMELVLPTAEHTIAYVIGNKYQEIGGFLSQYWTQLPSATQYYDYDRYSFDAVDGDREWLQLYAGALQDLKFVEETAIAKKDSNYDAVAKLLSAYAFHMVSDVHGDIPYSEALKGNAGILNPKYDEQSVVYGALLSKIDAALVLLNNGQANKMATSDPMFAGDMSMWKKFANTLKLRMVMRQSNTANFASLSSGLSTDPADYFGNGENAALTYIDKQGNKNPLYASIQGLGVNNNVASKTIGDTLNAYGDPRANFYFNADGAAIKGTLQGAAAAGGYPANSPISIPGAGVYGPTVPVYYFSGHEALFLLAELEARKGMASAKATYEEAVVASFDHTGSDTTGLGLFAGTYDFPTALTDQLNAIALQKWISLCGTQNMESWSEVRRLNYPVLKASKATELGNPTDLPARIPYPSNEETANANFPGQKDITLKMFWDL